MKTEMRRALAQESFEEKIRKVAQLIQLSATMKTQRVREEGNVTAPKSENNCQQSVDSEL